jgi:hypothetical protein
MLETMSVMVTSLSCSPASSPVLTVLRHEQNEDLEGSRHKSDVGKPMTGVIIPAAPRPNLF